MSLETKDRKGFFIFEVIHFHNDKKISKSHCLSAVGIHIFLFV